MTKNVLDGLDPEQRSACEVLTGPLCIVAGAGTGKTRTITHRIAHGVLSGAYDPREVLAVTHSQKAAGEMRHRLGVLGVPSVSARTFHSAALAQLRHFWPRLERDAPLAILDPRDRYALLRRALEKTLKRDATNDEVFDLGSEVGWGKARLLVPSQYAKAASALNRSPGLEHAAVAKAFKMYENLKEERGRLDFEDLLLTLSALLEKDPEVAADVRRTYAHFVVDEYQDVDPLQARLLDAWLGERDDICVVGDPRQSIYAFRGAEPGLFEEFRKRHRDARVVELKRDYRSTPEVVRVANTLIGSRQDSLVGQLASGPVPAAAPFASEALEERHVVSTIKRHSAAGVPLSEMAVLYRFNSQSARFEAALAAAGIPYVVADSERFFDRPEVKKVLASLWQAGRENPEGVGIELLRDVLLEMGFDRENPPSGAGAARSRFEAVNALLLMVESMPGVETLGVRYLLEEMRHRSQESHQPTQNGVTLCTLHKAKGLEWEVVLMVNVTEGSLPSAYATTPELVAEERRLAYVGVTRARRHLVLSFSKSNAKGWSAKPSRFLTSFASDGLPASSPTRRRAKRSVPRSSSNCADCSAPLSGSMRWVGLCASCVPASSSALADALLAWRRRTATETSTREDELMDDALLWQVVLARPTTLSAVIAVDGFNDSGACGYGREIASIVKRAPRDEVVPRR